MRQCFFVSSFFFCFLMIRRPPRSTLFPTRRSSDLPSATWLALTVGYFRFWDVLILPCPPLTMIPLFARLSTAGSGMVRSEEHTSELQSHSDLVCRLLLEKKKKHKIKEMITQSVILP